MSNMQVEVIDIRKTTTGSKFKAMADLKFNGVLVVKGFSVVDGKNGIFVSMPKKPSKDGRWFEIITPSDSLKRDIEDLVLEAYDKETDGIE